MEKKTIGFIGGGRIVRILLEGFKKVGVEFESVMVYDPNGDSLGKLKEIDGNIYTTTSDVKKVAKAEVLFLAVHPPMIIETLEKLQPVISKDSIVISLAPKITIKKMEELLPNVHSIGRMNPSAGNIINQGINPVAFSKTSIETDINYILDLFNTVGNTFIVEESKIEAYAVISAMGSTYFWFQLHQLKELGVEYGLEEGEAKSVISQMMTGTMSTLFESGIEPSVVMDLVPVKPLGEYEEVIKGYYREKLAEIYGRIRAV